MVSLHKELSEKFYTGAHLQSYSLKEVMKFYLQAPSKWSSRFHNLTCQVLKLQRFQLVIFQLNIKYM